MKRHKNVVKPTQNQRSISSYFNQVSSLSSSEIPKTQNCNLQKIDRSKVPGKVLSNSGKAQSNEDSSPQQQNKKRRREERAPSPESPDIIPPTPPSKQKVESMRKSCKRTSLSFNNSEHANPSRKTSCVDPRAVKSKESNSDSGNEHRKGISASRKVVYALTYTKSPPETKTSQNISPFNTGDDEVLKGILEQLSPQKSVLMGAGSTVNSEKNSHVKRNHRLPGDELVLKRDNTKSETSKDMPSSVSKNSEETGNDKVSSRSKPSIESSDSWLSSRSSRKSIASPSASEAPALKYPPLLFTPESFKRTVRDNKDLYNTVEKISSKHLSEGTDLKSSSDASLNSEQKQLKIESPLRRSPRKHNSSAVFLKHTKRVEQCENIQVQSSSSNDYSGVLPENGDKENHIINLRRSPRKSCASSLKKDQCLQTGVVVPFDSSTKNADVIAGISQSSSTFLDKDCLSEFENIFGFDNEHADVLSFMANVNEAEINSLDFHEAQLCEVVSIDVVTPYKEAFLCVRSIETHKTASCRVRGCWLACPVSEGDTISLEAVKDGEEWLLDNTRGLLVLHSDLLISGTTVVGSLFCSRRSVLSNLFRGMDSDSAVMVTGSIVHQLFQMVLQERKSTESEVRQLAEKLISSKDCIRMLYSANMSVAHILKELAIFFPRIVDFVETYMSKAPVTQKTKRNVWLGAPLSSSSSPSTVSQQKEKNQLGKNWDGKIIGICDIEETMWEPRLGIKGMVDVSVQVVDSHGIKKIMPLELKTGKASFSAEHRGQVTLYSMMMSRMGQEVDSGLLLYLREGLMQEVPASFNERKDLIQLRNNLAHFLLPRIPVIDEQTGQFAPPRLPEPISFESACNKCPYVTLCSVYLKQDGLLNLPSDHPMVSISKNKSQHLRPGHVDYVMHWVGLLLLEDTDQLQSAKLRHIWRYPPEERERRKQAIVNLRLLKAGVENYGKFRHTFVRQTTSCNSNVLSSDLRNSGLSIGDYILISTDKRLAIERGNIIDVDSSSVTVSTNRNLYERYACETFHLDASESNIILVFNLTNLGCLLDDSEVAEMLRGIIIDRHKPQFSRDIEKSVIRDCLPIFRKLNKNQRDALTQTLKTDSYLLIKGLPGTGKTATMVALVEVLVRAGLSVIVTSHTHSAVDNLLLRLKKVGLKFLRLGTDARIHPQLLEHSETALTQHCRSPEDLDKVFSEQQIVGVTCLGAGHAMLSNRRIFDICLVDESTQVLQPSILRPLFSAHRFVLVGDPEQLPPVVRCHRAQDLGMSQSLFARLDSEHATVSLTLNYRMNRVITDLANGLTYGGELKCGNEDVANATLRLSSCQEQRKEWLRMSLSTDINDSVVFVDTCGNKDGSKHYQTSANNGASEESACCNHFEKELVMELLDALCKAGVGSGDIGVMAPYRAQVSLLTQRVKAVPRLADIEVNTVDQFQGRDKLVIVYSCTRSDGTSRLLPKEREILNDKRRLTVAITRSKHKLILLGHSETLKQYVPFQKLLSCMSKRNIVSANL